MARDESEQGLTPSLLDRLIDADSAGTSWRRGYGIEQMVEVVQRDLEELLNTRQSHPDLPPEYHELQNSILSYGLPDLVSLNALTPDQRSQIGRMLELAVTRFEPRLRDVRARLIDAGDSKDRTIRFRVEGRLCVDPSPDVAFDTVLELTTGHYSVKPSRA